MTTGHDTQVRANVDATITTLAYVNVSWSESKTSYLDNFVPFALEILRLAASPLTPQEVSEGFTERFGLSFPVQVSKSILDRAVRTEKMQRVPRTQQVKIHPDVLEKLPDIAREQADCARRQNLLVDELIAHALEEFEKTWSREVAESALISYVDHHAVPLLGSSVRSGKFIEAETPEGADYVVASFISKLIERDPTLFEFIDQMIKGSMLASALYQSSGAQVDRKFKRTTLYLDTSVCLQALGYEGREAEEATREMLNLALSQDAQLACFRHTIKEIRGILENAKRFLRRAPGSESAMRGVVKHFSDQGLSASDVELALATLDADLERLQIRAVSTPDYQESLSVDEEEFQEVLQQAVGYMAENTLISDLNSLTAIHRLRRGASGPQLEECKAVFVTENHSLVRASRRFFNSGKHEFPLSILGHTLATLLWVKAPNLAPSLPRKRIIADSFAALSPTTAMWIKFSDEVERLRSIGEFTDEQVALLRYSHEAEQALMNVTLGDTRELTEVNVKLTLQKARDAVAAPVEEELGRERDRAEAAELGQAEALSEVDHKTTEVEGLTERIVLLEGAASRAREKAIERVARRWGAIANWIKGVAITLVVLGVLTAIDGFVPNLHLVDGLPGPLPLIVRVAAGVCALLAFVALLNGGSLLSWIDKRRDGSVAKAIEALS